MLQGDRREAPEQAYMAAWAANMTQALVPVMDPTDASRGAFNPACYIHTAFDVTGPFINGESGAYRARLILQFQCCVTSTDTSVEPTRC
jgi:hypothetical protein